MESNKSRNDSDNKLLEKWVKNCLPDDQNYLAALIAELQTYQTPKAQAMTPRPQHHSSPNRAVADPTKVTVLPVQSPNNQNQSIMFKAKSKRTPSSQLMNFESAETRIMQSLALIRQLKDKGYKVLVSNPEHGEEVYNNLISKKLKPLQLNNNTVFKDKKTPMDLQITNYYLNQDFYENKLLNVEIDLEGSVDKPMRDFIFKRQQLLKAIKTKSTRKLGLMQAHDSQSHNETSPVKRRLMASRLMPAKSLTSIKLKQSSLKHINRAPLSSRAGEVRVADELIEACHQYSSEKISEKLPSNVFQAVSKSARALDESLNSSYEVTSKGKIRQEILKQQLQRYSHNYMNMMQRGHAKFQSLSPHKKALIKDQVRLRKLLGPIMD